ncbi:alanine racemase [Paenibacillus sp. GYB004]|uniref:alanine racemase n=1 Tax=Paenibacillus sp. GYB004 TaxID=2994393 RepID=UPI002F9665EB
MNETGLNPLFYRETWAEVSLDAVARNTKLFRTRIAESCRLMAVVKANGYGHGAVETAKTALSAGAEALGVAILEEALELREAGLGCPILVLGSTPPAAIPLAVRHRIALTVYTEESVRAVISAAEKANGTAVVHLKLDTGMSRLGVTSKTDALRLARLALSSDRVRLEGVFTHFADADNPDPAYTERQFRTFLDWTGYLSGHGIDIPVKHCCNSAATVRYPDMHLNMVRVGVALYGLPPVAGAEDDYPLRQAMQLKTRITDVRRLPAGQSVGYGRTFTAGREMTVATIPIGYADGWSRRLSNNGSALVGNVRVPIVGRVCMDQTILDVSALSNAGIGDEVVLFGGTPGVPERYIPIGEVADKLDTIHYEVVCMLGRRVPRVYAGCGHV